MNKDQNNLTTRRYDLDWLRVIAFSILVFYHAGFIFTTDWYVFNDEFSPVLGKMMKFPSQWRIPLLLFISGAAVYFSMRKLTLNQYLQKRIVRLVIPVIVGIFLVNPVFHFIGEVFRGEHYGSYWEFYSLRISKIHFRDAGGIMWNHLWYVVYILVYSITLIPIFLYLKSKHGQIVLDRTISFVEKYKISIYLMALAPAITNIFLYPYWPKVLNLISDWDNFFFSMFFFLFGYIVCSNPRLWKVVYELRKTSLLLGFVLFILLAILYVPNYTVIDFRYIIFRILRTINVLAWIFTFVGYAEHYLNRKNKIINYLTGAIYPVYILHNTVLIAIAYYVVQLDQTIFVKLLICIVGTYGGTLLLYEWVIKRIKFFRVMFGLPAKRPNMISKSANRPKAYA